MSKSLNWLTFFTLPSRFFQYFFSHSVLVIDLILDLDTWVGFTL